MVLRILIVRCCCAMIGKETISPSLSLGCVVRVLVWLDACRCAFVITHFHEKKYAVNECS